MLSRMTAGPVGHAARQLQRRAVPGVRGVHALARTVAPRRTMAKKPVGIVARAMSAQASIFDAHDTFVHRHLGPSTQADLDVMLQATGYETMDALIADTVPPSIRNKEPLPLGPERGEKELLDEFKAMMGQNKVMRTHLGQGYYDTIVPNVILRNLLENPAWYTPYTPYQAEIAQGRLEMLLNFQTMVCDMTALPVANASLLDEATAAAEAMQLCFSMKKKGQTKFLVDSGVFAQTIDVLKTRATGYGIELVIGDYKDFDFDGAFGCLVQYPNHEGSVEDLRALADTAHENRARIVVASDLLALSQLTPPGEWGADVVVGSAQRFGVPMGFGGPHAAFFACQDAWKRKMPGRIIGVSRDARGKPALRMAMQTREQHIRRDKATSNICTAQALLANMSAAYAVYHGPEGIKRIGAKVHAAAKVFAHGVTGLGLTVAHKDYFDTVKINLNGANNADAYVSAAAAQGINIRKLGEDSLGVSFDETTTAAHIDELVHVFAGVAGQDASGFDAKAAALDVDVTISPTFARTSEFLTHPVFNMYHCETEMLRYLYLLQTRDLSLATAMIPLGSCTMKLNGTSEMIPVTWPEVGNMHPFAPKDQTQGYSDMLASLEKDLTAITGFHSMSMQPNAGSQGEYAGLLAISQYHASRGEGHRNICLIPTSAHGTNPASAVMSGMKVVVVKCDSEGNIDFGDLTAKAEKHKDNLAALMVTYPSTHGVFEENIKEVIDLIHNNGGQVYMDGANMNAQVGLCSPGEIGADVCHLNLHKTFCIPHGGGGPGMGPIGVAEHLAPFLPGHSLVSSEAATLGNGSAVAAAPFSSASILPITWMYINLMGAEGLTEATKVAILSANYMAKRLEGHYNVLYRGKNGTCAHEFILDLRPFKASAGIVEEDVAKRLMDYNFHSPTMSWPVVGTLMVEPTESESLYELDRMCDALIKIREEIREIEQGKFTQDNNLLKNAPHTADQMSADEWGRPYTRERAAYPEAYLKENKFWPFVGRLDNVYGDRNVVCTCPPLSAYSEE